MCTLYSLVCYVKNICLEFLFFTIFDPTPGVYRDGLCLSSYFLQCLIQYRWYTGMADFPILDKCVSTSSSHKSPRIWDYPNFISHTLTRVFEKTPGIEHQRVKTPWGQNTKRCNRPVVFKNRLKIWTLHGQERFCSVYAYCTRLNEIIHVNAP